MKHINITVNNIEEYNEGIKNLKKAGFELKDQSIAWDLWETDKTRYFVRKEF